MADLPTLPQVAEVAHTIQLSVAPVFLLAGVGAFLNVCASRLARVIDRARAVEALVLKARGREHDRLIAELLVLDRRISVVNTAIFLSVLSAVLICLVVVLLFAAELANVNFGTLIALLFIGSMVAIGAGFAAFIVETRLGSRIVHIRNEILSHVAEEDRPAERSVKE
jgi:Protein of unknown function (DUF2721)